VLFLSYHTEEFKAKNIYLRNFTAELIDNINAAVGTAKFVSKIENKTVHQYIQNLENIRQSKPVTSTDNVFIIVLTLIAILSRYWMFKILLYGI
jgi:hypothetical protein